MHRRMKLSLLSFWRTLSLFPRPYFFGGEGNPPPKKIGAGFEARGYCASLVHRKMGVVGTKEGVASPILAAPEKKMR